VKTRHKQADLVSENSKLAKKAWGKLSTPMLVLLADYTKRYGTQISSGDLKIIDGRWYVTHSGLLRIAENHHCSGIDIQLLSSISNASASRWAFKATVYKSPTCRGFVGHGDADPSNVSPVVQGAEMRVAETRAVNRALRKAYGIGLCSVEELGGAPPLNTLAGADKRRAQPTRGNGWNSGPKVRDRLCQLIRQHQLDAALVKSYCTDFCGVRTLREARREQVQNFVQHLSDLAEKDRNALLSQLNSYLGQKEGAA
jgi:hypothetical protein